PPAQKLYTEEKIQKVINGMASKLRAQNQRGCHYIEAIHEYNATASHSDTMHNQIRIGTRESQLAMWQAVCVRDLLTKHGFDCTLVPIKSEGDLDLKTPLCEMGVQGIFTRSLDLALLNNRIDIAVHSLKDVPTQV